MYTINIMGAGKGTYQKVKKVLKDHGIFEPANCKYSKEEKTFRFEWPKDVSIRPVREAVSDMGLAVHPEKLVCSSAVTEKPHPAAERIARTELRLETLESRVESVDRTLFQGLRGLVMLIDHLETVLDPTTTPEDKADALTRVQATIATMKEALG